MGHRDAQRARLRRGFERKIQRAMDDFDGLMG